MTVDPIQGTFTGLQCYATVNGSRDYAVTKGGYAIENTFDNPHPTGDAFPHALWIGRELKKLYLEREYIDYAFLIGMLTGSPTAGAAHTLVTGGTSLNTGDSVLTQAGTTAGGIVQVIIAGATTTTQTIITLTGTDINGNNISDTIVIPAGTLAAATLSSQKWFSTVAVISNSAAAGSGVTCTIGSIAGQSTTGAGAANTPATYTLVFNRGPQPVTNKQLIVTFANCMVKSVPDDGEGGKAMKQSIEFVVQNPNTDITFSWV